MPQELPVVDCEPYEGLYPLHEEWASGEIGGRDYRVLRSLQGPHVIVEFPQEEYDDYEEEREAYKFHIGDMVQHAHAVNSGEEE